MSFYSRRLGILTISTEQVACLAMASDTLPINKTLEAAIHIMIRVITIEREYGCGAAEIARGPSDRIGWKLWDQLLAQEIARLAHCQQSEVRQREERVDPLYYRLLKSFALEAMRAARPHLWRCSLLTVSSESPSMWFEKQRQPAIAWLWAEDHNTSYAIVTTHCAFFCTLPGRRR